MILLPVKAFGSKQGRLHTLKHKITHMQYKIPSEQKSHTYSYIQLFFVGI